MPFIKKSLSLLAKIKSKNLPSTILLGARSLKNLILLVQKQVHNIIYISYIKLKDFFFFRFSLVLSRLLLILFSLNVLNFYIVETIPFFIQTVDCVGLKNFQVPEHHLYFKNAKFIFNHLLKEKIFLPTSEVFPLLRAWESNLNLNNPDIFVWKLETPGEYHGKKLNGVGSHGDLAIVQYMGNSYVTLGFIEQKLHPYIYPYSKEALGVLDKRYSFVSIEYLSQKLFHNHLALLLLENEHVKINETSSQVKNYFGNIYSCDQLTVINPSPVLLDPTGLPIKGSDNVEDDLGFDSMDFSPETSVQKSSIVEIVHESRVIEVDISKCQKTTNHYTEVTKEIFNKMENHPAANFDSNYHYKGIYKHFAEEALSGKNAPNKTIQKESSALLKEFRYGENPTMLDYSINNG